MSKNKIRVLHVLGKRPVGGVGTFLKNMNENIDLNSLQFDYVMSASTQEGEFDKFVKQFGAQVFILPELRYKNTFNYFKQLNQFMKKNAANYDIIHVHAPNLAMFHLYLAKKYGVSIRIIHGHSVRYSDSFIKSIRNYFLQLPIMLYANAYFACSEDSAKFLFKKKHKQKLVRIVNNAINLEKYAFDEQVRNRVRKTLDVENNFVIGQVGSFLPVKNHLFTLEVFSEVYKQNDKAVLLLVGTGELEGKIRDKADNLGISEKVKFLGRRNDINELMQAFDYFMLPSLFEGMPLVGIEAQTAGVFCVFSDTISKDLKLTNSAYYKSLNLSPRLWADEILKSYDGNKERLADYEVVKQGGYDISEESNKMKDYYMELLSR